MPTARFLKTKAQRFFAAALVLFLSFAVGAAVKTEKVLKPWDWYFFTTDGSQIDIRSPNARMIIDEDLYAASDIQKLETRCDFQRRDPITNPVGANYRGVELCNTLNVSGHEFDIRNTYFRTRVDLLYSRYYSELTGHYVEFIGVGLITWLTLLASWLTLKWISRGSAERNAKSSP